MRPSTIGLSVLIAIGLSKMCVRSLHAKNIHKIDYNTA